MCAAFVRRVGAVSTAVTIASAPGCEIVIVIVFGSRIDDSFHLSVAVGCLEAAVEQHWRRHGGQGGAGARRPSPGRSAGGCGRPRQGAAGFFALECCFFASVAYVCVCEKVRMFTVLLCVCAVGPRGV